MEYLFFLNRGNYVWLFLMGFMLLGKNFLLGTSYSAVFNSTDYASLSTHAKTKSQAISLTSVYTPSSGDLLYGNITVSAGMSLTTTMTLNIIGQLQGTVTSSGGGIDLVGSVRCAPGFNVSGSLKINGNGRAIMNLSDDITLNGTNALEFGSDNLTAGPAGVIIDGGGKTVTLSGSNALTIDSSVSVTLRNMTLVFAYNQPIRLSAATSSLTLNNVKVVMSSAYASYYLNSTSLTEGGSSGLLTIVNNVEFSGWGATFIYNSSSTLSLASGATLTFGPGTTFQYWAGAAYRFFMPNATPALRFNNSNLTISSATCGMQLKKGRLEFDNLVAINNVNLSVSSSSTNTDTSLGLIIGDGISANNVDVRIMACAYVVVNGALYYNQG